MSKNIGRSIFFKNILVKMYVMIYYCYYAYALNCIN